MFRLLLLLAIGLIIYVWFTMRSALDVAQDIGITVTILHECLDRHQQQLVAEHRSNNFYSSFSDATAYQVYVESRRERAESACIEESGFKILITEIIDQLDVDEAAKSRMRRTVLRAESLQDVGRIFQMIK